MLSLCCHVILGDSSLNNPTSHPHSPCGRRSRNARVVFFCGVQVVLYLEAAAAMSGEAEALLVVNQLRDLAADPMNRRAIVQDQGCLPGLILFLDHPNPQVVYSALLALRYLAECRANREKMEGELGMMLSLQNVIQKSTTPGETKLLASEVYELLQASSGPESDRAEGAPSGRRKAQFFLGSTNKRAKTVVLHIDGLDDSSHRTLCEEALLKIRGVISFTFQMAVKRCIVRIRSDLKAEGKFILQPCSQNDTHKRRLPNLTPQKLKGAGVGHCLYRSSDSPAGGEGREWPRDFDPLHGGRLSTGGAERRPAGLSARGGGPGRGARQGSDPGGQRAGWRYLARHRCQLPVSFLLLVTQWGLASPRSRT
ncbi:armadillo repeat-containing protein 1-like isoform X1 [Gadus macrocephalus]|uniref:armadillo repeat-containing protein 1-like isoform X1 n=2 Tax=Gadus macrocephalus TaxID=80720 RepID=UPI0028CBBE69|nr:armadillo repeat-containing protein 1-like isoform X1 [Gadus macrocephalus]